MPQKSFLIVVSLGAIVLIVFAALANSLARGFSISDKKNVFILLLTSILNSVVLFAITYLSDDPYIIFWIFSGIYLIFGIITVLINHEKFVPEANEKIYVVTIAEIFFTISIALFVTIISSLLQFYLKDKTFLFFPVACSAIAFLLPLFFVYTFDAAANIPPTDFLVWEYPSKRIDPPAEGVNENMVVIGFDIAKRAQDKKTSFRAKAPENIILGELFYHFINEYNEEKSETPIEYLNQKKQPIVWWFRLKPKWYQFNKVLDPSLRIRDNFIKENSVIICEQLIQPADNAKKNER